MIAQGKLKYIECYGTPRKRGQIHGESLRVIISEVIGSWKDWLSSSSGMDPDEYIRNFLDETNFLPSIKRWVPGLLDEVHGIAEGASSDFGTIFAWQCMDEYWWHLNNRMGASRLEKMACSGFGVWGQQNAATILCQTDDLPVYFEGGQVTIRMKHQDSDLELLIFTIAGMIIQNGVNSFSIGAMINTLCQLDHSLDGLPTTFVTRGILQCQSLQKAEEFVRAVNHASGMNYLIGSPKRVIDLECSANNVVQYLGSENSDYVVHTNHPLMNEDTSLFKEQYGRQALKSVIENDHNATSSRFMAIEDAILSHERPIRFKDAKTILSLDPVSVHRSENSPYTIGCTIAELTGAPIVHIAPGPPDSSLFSSFKI